MKLVAYFENGMEGVTLTPKQLELIRRGVACLYEDRKDEAARIDTDLHLTPREHLIISNENDADIEAIEQLREILYQQEVYEKAKEA